MKRIALLLAGAVLGTGCIVDTSDPCDRAISVDWLFVDAFGNPNRDCTQVGVNNVDVWIDGVRVGAAIPCTNYGRTFYGYDSGSHDVVVEGYFDNLIINRDWYTLPPTCSDALFQASPGEGDLDIQPTLCEVGTTYLTYRIVDVTPGRPTELVDEVRPTDTKLDTCVDGITFPVPYGYYDLDQIEETSSNGLTVYAAKCSPTAVDVLNYGLNTTNVSLSAVPPAAVCNWP